MIKHLLKRDSKHSTNTTTRLLERKQKKKIAKFFSTSCVFLSHSVSLFSN